MCYSGSHTCRLQRLFAVISSVVSFCAPKQFVTPISARTLVAYVKTNVLYRNTFSRQGNARTIQAAAASAAAPANSATTVHAATAAYVPASRANAPAATTAATVFPTHATSSHTSAKPPGMELTLVRVYMEFAAS